MELDLYNRSKAMNEAFGTFLEHYHTEFPENVNGANWWTTITNRVHIQSAIQEGDIRSPIHRLLHWFIASTINMQKDDDKVPNLDLFFLWSIITPNVFLIYHIVWRNIYYREGQKTGRDQPFLVACL